MAAKKKAEKPVTANVKESVISTLAGAGIAGLSLWANGVTPKQIGISASIAVLGALVKDPKKK